MARRRTKSWSSIVPALIILAILGSIGVFASAPERKQQEEAANQQKLEQEAAEGYHDTMKILATEGFSFSSDASKAVTLIVESEGTDTGTYSRDHIPDTYVAKKPEEVRYVIRIATGHKEVGTYTDFSKAYKHWADVTVEDMFTGELLALSYFVGENPPEYKSSDGDIHSYPNEREISAWVQKALDRDPNVMEEAEIFLQEREDALNLALEILGDGKGHSAYMLQRNLNDADFSSKAVTYAVENCNADWNEQALLVVKESVVGWSLSGAKDWLKEKGFSKDEITYAVNNWEADWNEQAVICAQEYLEIFDLSYEGTVQYLRKRGFNNAEAYYGADNCGADWDQMALEYAKQYYLGFGKDKTREDIIQKLLDEKFTQEQAEYAVSEIGIP